MSPDRYQPRESDLDAWAAPMPEDRLTEPQRRMLAAVRAAGVKVYNGRARRTVEALEAAGLVEVEWDSVVQARGGGIELVERLTVRPAEGGA